MDFVIDYQCIADALKYYSRDFRYIEVPWNIDIDTMLLTAPNIESVFCLDQIYPQCLVGSAEQSFLYLAKQNKLNKNVKYMACTPCFRNETEDTIHQKYFMKVELFILSNSINDLNFCLEKAKLFFETYKTFKKRKIDTSKTEIGYDLNFDELN